MFGFQRCTTPSSPPENEFDSSKASAKSEPNLQCCAASPHNINDDVHLSDESMMSASQVFYHMLESILRLILFFVHGKQNVRSYNSCQVQAFQDNL